MKKLFFLIANLLIINFAFSQNGVSINATGNPADSSAILDVNATDGGILIPRLSTTERNAIPSPADGLLIYNTNNNKFNYYNGTSPAGNWYEIEATSITGTTGAVTLAGGVAINTTGAGPDLSAILDVSDASRGVLVPRINGTTGITGATGLIFYNTATNLFNYYDGSGWIALCGITTGASGATGSQSSTGVAIVVNGFGTDQSAILDVIASDKGILIPRLTTAQRNVLSAVQGLTIYNTDNKTIEYYNGSSWYKLEQTPAQPSAITSGTGTTICSGVGQTYTVTNVSGVTYTWTYSGTGWSQTGGGTSNSITASATGSGTVTVTSSNSCGDGTPQTLAITVTPANTITLTAGGTQTVCINTAITTTIYTTTGATGATVTGLPGGVTGSWATNTVTISGTPTASGTFNYTVTLTGGCGTVTAADTITVKASCPCVGVTSVSYDGGTNTCATVELGAQCWMTKNMNVHQTAHGTDWCYNNNSSYCTTYGRLYDWAAAMQGASSSSSSPSGVQGVCPSGWHFPSDAEWTTLTTWLSTNLYGCASPYTGTDIAKSMASVYTDWTLSTTACAIGNSTPANNVSGFTALPGGRREGGAGTFDDVGIVGFWWTATEYADATSNVWIRYLHSAAATVHQTPYLKPYWFSVRCLKDY